MNERGTEIAEKIRTGERGDSVKTFLNSEIIAGIELPIIPEYESRRLLKLPVADRAEEMWRLTQRAKALADADDDNSKKQLARAVARAKLLFFNEETVGAYRSARAQIYSEKPRITTPGRNKQYRGIAKRIVDYEKRLEELDRDVIRQKRTKNNVDPSDSSERQALMAEIADLQDKTAELTAFTPELSAQESFDRLRRYAEQYRTTRYIRTPSRERVIKIIEDVILTGRPLFFMGPPGTGKGSVFDEIARVVTGEKAEHETITDRTNFDSLVAKPTIEKGVYEYGPLGRALTGKRFSNDAEAQHKGRAFFADEINNGPEQIQTAIAVNSEKWKPGTVIELPVTGEKITVPENFMFGYAANFGIQFKKEDMSSATLRKSDHITVPHMSRDEMYESMLAALEDENGWPVASQGEIAPEFVYDNNLTQTEDPFDQNKKWIKRRVLSPDSKSGGFLWRLARALDQVNISSSGIGDTVLKDRGVGQYLGKVVIGLRVLEWLETYRQLNSRGSLENFMIEKLHNHFYESEAYKKSGDDVKLLGEFFAYFGIDITKLPEKEKKKEKENKILMPGDIGKLSPNTVDFVVEKSEPIVKEGSWIIGDRSGVFVAENSERMRGPAGWSVVEFTPSPDHSTTHEALRSAVEQRTRAFFGNKYDSLFSSGIPELPPDAFPAEVFERIESQEIAAYYLPEMDLANIPGLPPLNKDSDAEQYRTDLSNFFPNWNMPDKQVFQLVINYLKDPNSKDAIHPDALKKPARWFWIDVTQKPNRGVSYKQNLTDSQLLDLAADEMSKAANTRVKEIGEALKLGNRHDITHAEVTGEEFNTDGSPNGQKTGTGVLDYLAKALNIDRANISLPSLIEWSFTANEPVFSKENRKPNDTEGWGSTNMRELIEGLRYWDAGDSRRVDRLIAGSSGHDGLRDVLYVYPDSRLGNVAFRPFGSASR